MRGGSLTAGGAGATNSAGRGVAGGDFSAANPLLASCQACFPHKASHLGRTHPRQEALGGERHSLQAGGSRREGRMADLLSGFGEAAAAAKRDYVCEPRLGAPPALALAPPAGPRPPPAPPPPHPRPALRRLAPGAPRGARRAGPRLGRAGECAHGAAVARRRAALAPPPACPAPGAEGALGRGGTWPPQGAGSSSSSSASSPRPGPAPGAGGGRGRREGRAPGPVRPGGARPAPALAAARD